MMGFLTEIFETLGGAATGIGGFFTDLFTAIIAIFYVSPDGGTAPAEITVVGALVLVGAAMGLFMWAFKWIRSLIKLRG